MNSEWCTVYFQHLFHSTKKQTNKTNVNLLFKMLHFLCWKYNRKPHGQAFKQISSPLSELYFMLHNRSHHPERSDPGDVRPCCTSFVSFRLIDALNTSTKQFQLHQLHFHLMMLLGSDSMSASKQESTTSFQLCCVQSGNHGLILSWCICGEGILCICCFVCVCVHAHVSQTC